MATNNFIDASPFINDPEKLKKMFDDLGYLYIQKFLPEHEIDIIYNDIMEILIKNEYVTKDRTYIYNTIIDYNDIKWKNVEDELWKLESFHILPHIQILLNLFSIFLDNPILVHPRIGLRTVSPSKQTKITPTQPHQDYPEIQGTPNTLTMWFPLHDCDIMEGLLGIVPYSHLEGIIPIKLSEGTSGIEVTKPILTIHSQKMNKCDILIFHSYTVHFGFPNTSDKMRISIDARYQSSKEPISENCINLVGCDYSWDEVYKNWEKDNLKYYWNNLNISPVKYDRKFDNERDQQAIDLGKAGNKNVKRILEYAYLYNPDEKARIEAKKVLDELNKT